MKTIEEYMDKLRKEIRPLARKEDDSEILEYGSHLSSAFEKYKAESISDLSEEQLEEEFILEQENPHVIARSMVRNPVSLPVYYINKKLITVEETYSIIGKKFPQYDQKVPFIDAVLCMASFLFLGIPFLFFINDLANYLDPPNYTFGLLMKLLAFHSIVFFIILVLAIKRGLVKGVISAFHITSLMVFMKRYYSQIYIV